MGLDTSTRGEPGDEDIANSPTLYRNYGGRVVRIQVYWTTPIVTQSDQMRRSFQTIDAADGLLRKYTLSLDMGPRSIAWNYYKALRVPGRTLQFGGQVGTMSSSRKEWEALHALVEPIKEENRLIVIFAYLYGKEPAAGFTVLDGQWLPWVIVDPRDASAGAEGTLLHEIGHACGLGHTQKGNEVATGVPDPTSYKAELDRLHNVMGEMSIVKNQLWPWQVDKYANSYWCGGSRPVDWWMIKTFYES